MMMRTASESIKRRVYFLALTTSIIATAGCSSTNNSESGTLDDCTITESTESVESVPVTVDGRVKDGTADTVIDLEWNARTQNGTTVSRSSNAGYPPDEGQKTIIIKVNFVNTTNGDVTVNTKLFGGFVETPDLSKEVSRVSISARIVSDINLKPEGQTQGYMAYHVPADSTSFTLQAVPKFDGNTVGLTPNCYKELLIELGEFPE